MTTIPLSPECWAIDPGPHAALVAAYFESIGRAGYDTYTMTGLVAAARHLCAWAQLSGRDGFEWQGCRFRSLSAVAREITGTRWNGYRFFGLRERGREDA